MGEAAGAQGRPKLVLLPGLDGSGRLFGAFSGCVSEAVEPHSIGYPNDRLWGYEELLAFVLERLPDGPCILLGESFSGPLAAMLAAAEPARVSGLVLVSSFARLPVPTWVAGMAGRFDAARCPHWFADFVLTGGFTPPAMRAELFRQVKSLTPALVERRLHAVLGADVRPIIDDLQCPLLAVHGRADRLVPLWWARRDLGRRGGVEFHAVDGPHMLLQSAPEAVAARIIEWLDRKQLRGSA